MSERPTREDFAAHLNSSFYVKPDETNQFELSLAECNDLGTTDKQEQFSLVFRGPANFILPQMIYPMTHEKMGDLQIFLVPIRKDDQGVYYEAVFNYFR